MRVFGEEGEEQEAKDELITEPSSIFNRLALFFISLFTIDPFFALNFATKTVWQ